MSLLSRLHGHLRRGRCPLRSCSRYVSSFTSLLRYIFHSLFLISFFFFFFFFFFPFNIYLMCRLGQTDALLLLFVGGQIPHLPRTLRHVQGSSPSILFSVLLSSLLSSLLSPFSFSSPSSLFSLPVHYRYARAYTN